MSFYEAILFDFDGTIADTSRGIKNSIRYALAEKGIPVGDESKLDYFIGPPLYEGFSHTYHTNDADTDELVKLYRIYYAEKGVFECELFPGMKELLKTLHEKDVKTAVVSSKPLHFLKIALPHLGIDGYFDAVIGPSMDNTNADKSALVARAAEELGHPLDSQMVMVGDRFYDIEGAKRAGITAIGATFGFGSEQELLGAGADLLAEDAERLSRLLLANPGDTL